MKIRRYFLSDEALPSITTSTSVFANVPEGTVEIWLTLRTAGVTLTFDGGAATAGGNGHDFAADPSTPYVFEEITQARALAIKAIQNGGTATGWITYWG